MLQDPLRRSRWSPKQDLFNGMSSRNLYTGSGKAAPHRSARAIRQLCAWATSKLAQRHTERQRSLGVRGRYKNQHRSESDLMCAKCRKVCMSERCKVTKCSAHHEKYMLKFRKAMFYLDEERFFQEASKHCACHEKWTWGIWSPAPATRNHPQVPNRKMAAVSQNVRFRGFKTSSKIRICCACRVKWRFSDPLQMTHACQRFSSMHEIRLLPIDENVSKVLHLLVKTRFWALNKFAESIAPATYSFKNGHGTQAKTMCGNRGS